MVQSVPVEQLRSNYVVALAAPWQFDWLVLTKPTGSDVAVDGLAVTQDKFIQIGPAGMPSGWEVARIPVTNGRHVLDGDQPFSAVLVGYGVFSSYAYPGGTNLKQLNP